MSNRQADQELVDLVMRREQYQYQVLLELEFAGRLPLGRIGTAVFLYLAAVVTTAGGFWFFQLPVAASLIVVAVLTAWLVWILTWTRTALPRQEAGLRDQIQRSGLVEKLAEGTQWISEIYLYTHWFWAFIGLGWRPRKFQEWIRLLAWNLDWYLAPPRPLFRPEWVIRLAQFTLPLIVILSQFFTMVMQNMGVNHRIILGTVLLLLLVVLVPLMLSLPALFKRRAAAVVLHRIMLEHYDA